MHQIVILFLYIFLPSEGNQGKILFNAVNYTKNIFFCPERSNHGSDDSKKEPFPTEARVMQSTSRLKKILEYISFCVRGCFNKQPGLDLVFVYVGTVIVLYENSYDH